MRVRIEERDPTRLRDVARDWGVKAVEGQHPEVVAVAIANAYRRAIEKEKMDDDTGRVRGTHIGGNRTGGNTGGGAGDQSDG